MQITINGETIQIDKIKGEKFGKSSVVLKTTTSLHSLIDINSMRILDREVTVNSKKMSPSKGQLIDQGDYDLFQGYDTTIVFKVTDGVVTSCDITRNATSQRTGTTDLDILQKNVEKRLAKTDGLDVIADATKVVIAAKKYNAKPNLSSLWNKTDDYGEVFDLKAYYKFLTNKTLSKSDQLKIVNYVMRKPHSTSYKQQAKEIIKRYDCVNPETAWQFLKNFINSLKAKIGSMRAIRGDDAMSIKDENTLLTSLNYVLIDIEKRIKHPMKEDVDENILDYDVATIVESIIKKVVSNFKG